MELYSEESPPVLEPPHRNAISAEEFARQVLLQRKRLVQRAKRYSLSPEQAEDAVQQAFMKAWRALASFRGDSKFSTWITRILINEILQMKRAEGRVALLPLEPQDGSTAAPVEKLHSAKLSPEDACFRREARAFIRSSIHQLPPNLRSTLEMRIVEDRSVEDVARSLKLTIPAVKTRLSRGRLELKRRLLSPSEKQLYTS